MKRIALFVARHVLRAVWLSTMVLTPLFGFWLASSLAAYNNATQWLSLLVGLLLFPILPVGWDLFFVWRRSKQPARKAILTRIDRLVLRTLIVNGLFLGGMLYWKSETAFRALAVRGDWMLDGYDGPIASRIRGALLAFADRLDSRTTPNADHYGKSDEAPDEVAVSHDDAKPAPAGDPKAWPMAADFDPLVANMPDADQASIESVGKYLAAHFTDQRQLVKAIHDYVVNRLHYDYDALQKIQAGDYANTPPQTAETVFERRAGVCEGYARLMVALGKAAGADISYVVGYIRDSRRRLAISDDPWDANNKAALEGVSHAWNAAKIDGQWYLIDATWDDPSYGEHTTTYLFPPPRLMAYDHFPEEAAWQLVASPMSLGDFVRQPLMSPSIGAYGLALVEPTRSQITVDGTAEIVLDSSAGAKMAAEAHLDGTSRKADDGIRCAVAGDKRIVVTCNLPDGAYEVQLFAAKAGSTRDNYEYVGSVLVNSH